jgi:hypothetical protein
MSLQPPSPIPRRALSRSQLELMVGVAWNAEGTRRGLLPLAWRIGDGDLVHFIGSADAYAAESRREIIEDWIAGLGLVDSLDPVNPALHRRGGDMVWTGSIDSVGLQFHYPVDPDEPCPDATAD